MGEANNTEATNEPKTPAKTDSSEKVGLIKKAKESLVSVIVGALFGAIPFTAIGTFIGRYVTPPQAVPIGTIIAWNGKGGLPSGEWELCDGKSRNPDVPNLTDQFLQGSDINGANKQRSMAYYVKAGLNPNSGLANMFANRPGDLQINMPPGFTVVFIMKVR